ncbi:nuclear transport factor 2 family protein [Euzebya tangerina]|uniref:nuclear transport factor 2 family protein n=1 Tax=Euzebya tangerina TaxID=591198 RepID=UPI0013C33154|nr:nuclear transport factor 2 family protein [Euzebya tangerina]
MSGSVAEGTPDLEARVRRLEDRAALQELAARYAMAVDDRDWDAVEAMYTQDAVFDSVEGRIEGREPVVAYYRHRTDMFGATYHYPHSQVLEFGDDGTATGVVAAHAELAIGEETVMIALRYNDTYVFSAEGDGEARWRFRERVVQQLYAMPLADLQTGLAESNRKRWPGTDPAPAELPLAPGLPR